MKMIHYKYIIAGVVVLALVSLAVVHWSNNGTNSVNTGPANSTVLVGEEIPAVSGYVVDNAGIIDASAEESLITKLQKFDETDKGQIAVLTVKTLNGLSIEEFAIRVGEKWKVGDATVDNGVIVIIASDERKVRIEVGRGASITDAQAGQILDDAMVPKLKRADWAGAVNDGVDEIIKLLNK